MVLTEDRHLVALHDYQGEQIHLVLLVLHIASYPINDGEAHQNRQDLTPPPLPYPGGACAPYPPVGGGPYPPAPPGGPGGAL